MTFKFCVTFFPNQSATRMTAMMLTLPELADKVLSATAPKKDKLPWFKFATFGKERSEKNCLRHDKNVITVSGCEGDHDFGLMTFEEAVRKAHDAHLYCLLYTSASYKPEKQRWRVVCPFSCDLPPAERKRQMKRLKNVFGPIFDPGSFDSNRLICGANSNRHYCHASYCPR